MIREEYPTLRSWIDEIGDRHGKITAVTLGPGGAWFVRTKNDSKGKLPAKLVESLTSSGEFNDITCLALGYNSSYVAVWKSGLITWDLHSQYAGLESSLASAASGIKVIIPFLY